MLVDFGKMGLYFSGARCWTDAAGVDFWDVLSLGENMKITDVKYHRLRYPVTESSEILLRGLRSGHLFWWRFLPMRALRDGGQGAGSAG